MRPASNVDNLYEVLRLRRFLDLIIQPKLAMAGVAMVAYAIIKAWPHLHELRDVLRHGWVAWVAAAPIALILVPFLLAYGGVCASAVVSCWLDAVSDRVGVTEGTVTLRTANRLSVDGRMFTNVPRRILARVNVDDRVRITHTPRILYVVTVARLEREVASLLPLRPTQMRASALPTTTPPGPSVVPDKMPMNFWAYGFWCLVGAFLLVALTPSMAATAGRIGALARLPRSSDGEPGASGAVFDGRLEGQVTTTALGHQATAWVGIATVTIGTGKGTHPDEKCRIGVLGPLALRPDGGGAAMPIAAPSIETVDPVGRVVPFRQGREPTHYCLGQAVHVSSLPAAVVERCRLGPENLERGRWTYDEHWAAPGTHVEIAGCLAGKTIVPCAGTDVALGHLSADGLHAVIRRFADRTMLDAAGLGLVTTFFVVVGGVGALLVLRRAARGAPSV